MGDEEVSPTKHRTPSTPQLVGKAPAVSESQSPSRSPYGLREKSQVPARYRQDVGEPESSKSRTSPSKTRKAVLKAAPKLISAVPRPSLKPGSPAVAPPLFTASRSSSPSKRTRLSDFPGGASPHTIVQVDDDNDSVASFQFTTKPRGRAKKEAQPYQRPAPPPQLSRADEDVNIDAEQLLEEEDEQLRLAANEASVPPLLSSNTLTSHVQRKGIMTTRPRAPHTELTPSLRDNLRRLKNVLKLPKARRWVYCELFYSGVDEQLFLGDNEFSQLLRESFPNLKTRNLCRPEWRAIRRLIGKPRRCSTAFLEEERIALEQRRTKIRQIYEGTLLQETHTDLSDLPLRLPRPLVVGMKIHARVRHPKDGIYAGTIDAVLPDAYRVVFEKEEMIPPMIIPDSEVMTDGRPELVGLTYFLEQNRAALPAGVVKLGPAPFLPNGKMMHGDSRTPKADVIVAASQAKLNQKKGLAAPRDEKVGNFPVRMLVLLVKLSKLIEMKKQLVRQLTELNAEAERANLLGDVYHVTFQDKYAQVVVDLESLNKQMATYLHGISDYHAQLLPQLSEVAVTARPDALRKLCNTHSLQIVKHCNNGLDVKNKRSLELIGALTSLLLQVRSLGQQRCTPLDLYTLQETISEIKKQVTPRNQSIFEDCVEVHMKQIHQMMLNNGSHH